MKIVCDTDILSTFARIRELRILSKLFDSIIIPNSVNSELKAGEINLNGVNVRAVEMSKEELKSLRQTDSGLGKREAECFVIAKFRHLPLASNEKVVQALCSKERVGYLSLLRILRYAIQRDVISRERARKIVRMIEFEENTTIRNMEEIFK